MAWTDSPLLNDPEDPAFKQDMITQLQKMIPAGATDAQITQAIQTVVQQMNTGSGPKGPYVQSNGVPWGSGSVPYNAAYQIAQSLGPIAAYDPAQSASGQATAEGRSKEGVARANDSGGLFGGGLLPLLLAGAGLAFGMPELGGMFAGAGEAGGLAAGASGLGEMGGMLAGGTGLAGDAAGLALGGEAAGAAGGSTMGLQDLVGNTGMTQEQIANDLQINGITDANGNMIPGADASKSSVLQSLAQQYGTTAAKLVGTLVGSSAAGGAGGTSGNLLGALIGAYGSNQNSNLQMSLLDKAINSDQFRTQQPSYFGPLYNAAVNGQMPSSLRDQITGDTARKMSSMGYNMSGNQMSQISQDLNRGAMDYTKVLTPLAMGNSSAAATGAVANMTPGIVGANNQTAGNLGVAANSLLSGLFNTPTGGTTNATSPMTGLSDIPSSPPSSNYDPSSFNNATLT